MSTKPGGSACDAHALSRAAENLRAKIRALWEGFEPGPPQLAVKRRFDVEADEWMEEPVMVQIGLEPFGEGAFRECFRMKEVRVETSHDRRDGGAEKSPIVDRDGKSRFKFEEVARCLMELPRSDRRSMWVAKRSISSFEDLETHKRACETDVILQTLAKHYAELFNSALHRAASESGLGRCGAHDIDFLLSHIVELPDGSTYGAEAFVIGDYIKHNTNSGGTMGARRTPQVFSYFTFVRSNRRLMIVDIQGVDDLYTDPAIHFLPKNVSKVLRNADNDLNFGIRGFALFLWSHRRTEVDQLLNLPTFALSTSEQNHAAPLGTATLAEMLTSARKSKRAGAKKAQETCNSDDEAERFEGRLDDLLGVDLSGWCDWRTVLPFNMCVSAFLATNLRGREACSSELELVDAECHMEIVGMYLDGYINLRSLLWYQDHEPSKIEIEAAVFHLIEAARLDLVEALLGLACLTSGRAHDDFLPQIRPFHQEDTCLALLARAASLKSTAAMGSLARKVLQASQLDDLDVSDLRCAAVLLEAFAELSIECAGVTSTDTSNDDEDDEEDETQEHSCFYGRTFGWEDHGWHPHSALLRAAEIWDCGKLGDREESERNASRLRKRASEVSDIVQK
eukprot:TRINITY_DN21198_c0_g1_i1.p1 TRINITY_DN21198_c0_g1~~TRINITY_DN21198_c0_g1_i1.p1  ORF type:complete len:624 (+),score=115.05 TRINITY_DN21198_c0_g1_i1:83-1954(+)